MVRLACVGAGAWGRNLIRNFASLGVLHVVCDPDADARGRISKHYPGVETTDSFDRIVSDRDVDAIVLATPAKTHAAMATQALLAGKDVFVEKPLALTLEDGRAVVETAKRTDRLLMVGHVLQYHPAVVRLNELITRGDLGKLQYVYSARLNIGRVRREENILWSFAPHDISTILTVVGESPNRVHATGGTYLQQGVPDVTLTIMEFPGGVRGHVFVSWLHPIKEQKLVVIGDRKMAVFDDQAKEKLMLFPHQVEWIDRAPVAHRADGEVVPIESEEPLAAECRHFLECVERRLTPRTDGSEALRVLAVLQASQLSLDRQGVTVPLAPALSLEGRGEGEGSRLGEGGTLGAGGWAHPTSIVDSSVEIGGGTKIWQFSRVLSGSRIGANCNIGQNVVIGPNVSIGDRVKIQNNVSVYEGVTLEDYVFCGPSMVFTNVMNPRSAIPRKAEIKRTLVREGATLGANSTILCGITIGRHAFIGAGAVVTGDVPDYALVVGNPARPVGWMCACGVKLRVSRGRAVCTACAASYRVSAKGGCRPSSPIR